MIYFELAIDAITSRELTGTIGILCGNARPYATPEAILMPVNEPGPDEMQ